MSKQVVIIGGGAVGMSIATHLRRHTDHKVAVLSSDSHIAYSQCGMPFVLEGVIPGFTDLIVRPIKAFREMDIELHLKTPVDHIDVHDQKVLSRAGMFKYHYLVIATGSTPFIPPIKGRDLEGVFTLHTLSDGMSLQENLGDHVVIIGAGGIGTETAAALTRRGLDVTLVEALPRVLSMTLDPDMSALVENYLTSQGVKVITAAKVESINGTQHVESVTAAGEHLNVDTVIIATGLRPNTGIARDAGFDIGPTGGIVTDKRLRASYQGQFQDNVYAGGECAQVSDLITGEPIISQLGSAARRMARVIAQNLAGNGSVYPPTLNPGVVVVGELIVGSVGITTQVAADHNIRVVTGTSRGLTRAGYYPGARPLDIKLLFSHRKLVGAQVISMEGVKERIDALSLAIRMGATVDDLLSWETSYSPPVSAIIDPVTFAADDAKKSMEALA